MKPAAVSAQELAYVDLLAQEQQDGPSGDADEAGLAPEAPLELDHDAAPLLPALDAPSGLLQRLLQGCARGVRGGPLQQWSTRGLRAAALGGGQSHTAQPLAPLRPACWQ